MSDRIRVIGGPWPERIGLTGSIVPTSGHNVYPFAGLGRNEVVVLLDDDPLQSRPRYWSCVMDRRCIEVADG